MACNAIARVFVAGLALVLVLAPSGSRGDGPWWGLGKVHPKGARYKQTYDMAKSTGIMICNNSGQVNAEWAARWGLVDIDWNSDKVDWSKPHPMDSEENMLRNAEAIREVNPTAITWVYRNGIKALPWFTDVREKLQDKRYWGWFVAKKGCNPAPGVYSCGATATANLYHDFEQTPRGDCGDGVECGEYVFDHRNRTLLPWLIGSYFLGNATGGGNPAVDGFYVDDGWSIRGPSEMDKDAVEKMGMSAADVQAMIAAWSNNVAAWREAIWNAGLFEWFMFYGGQQTAPGWSQTEPNSTCLSFMRKNCGAGSPSQNGTMFFGYSRYAHSQAWGNASKPGQSYGSLLSPTQDLAVFLLTRGPYAFFGYGWTGCADQKHPFTRPAALDADYGTPVGYCEEVQNGVFKRKWTKADVSIDCNAFTAEIKMMNEQ